VVPLLASWHDNKNMNFFVKYKRVFLIIGFLSFIAIMAYLLYMSFFKPALPTGPTQDPISGQGPGGQLIPSPEGPGQVVVEPGSDQIPGSETIAVPSETASGGLTKTKQLLQDPVLKPVLGGNGTDVNFYNKNDGKFYRMDENGQATAISDKVFHNVSNVTWSPVRNKAVLEYPDGSNIVYDFNSGKQVTLPKHWEDFDFSNDGNNLIMKSIGLDVDNRWLAISKSDGSGSQALEFIGKNADRVYPDWSPNGQMVAMYTQGVDLNRQEVFFVGLNNENFKSTIVEGRGFEPMWSEKGDRLAYSVYDLSGEAKPELWVVDASGDAVGANRKKLNVQTWASKCTFADNNTMYCGVPETLQEGAGMFPETAQSTRDDLYMINVATGEKSLVAIPEGNHNMNNLMISQDGKNLYFTDSKDSLIRKIELE
jgi:Tol biopolymer transport system component